MAGPLANRTPSGPGAMAGAAEALGWLAVCFAAAAAAAGLFVPTLYRDVAGWVQQAQGADLSTLVLAIPLSVVAGRAAARGSTAGRLATLGVLLYLAYTYAVSAFSVAINPLTVVYIAVLGLSVWASLLTAASVDTTAANRLVDARLPRRASATFLVVIAVLFGLLWLGQLATVALTGRPPEELVRLRLPTNPIYALDLAFFLPACVVAAVGLFRGMAVRVLAPPLLVFAALIGAESLGGFLFTAAAGEEVPVPVAVVLGVVALVAAALVWVALRPTGTPNAGVEPRSATVDSVDADHAWAGLGLALGAGIGAGLGIVAAVVLSLDVASGIVAGAAVGVIVGLLGGASVERGRS